MLFTKDLYSFNITDASVSTKDYNKTDSYNFYNLEFKSELNSKYPENNYVCLKLYLPHNIEKHLTAIIHGFGTANSKYIEKHVCKKLAKWGLPNFLISLPYHIERTPSGKRSGQIFAEMDAEESYFFFNQSQNDVRKALHLVSKKYNLKNKFNLLGMSLGGIVAFITGALDKNVKKVSLALSGGYFYQMLWTPILRILLKHDCNKEECKKNYRHYLNNYKSIQNKNDLKKISEIKPCFLYEPLSFVNFYNDKDVLIFAALFDEFITPKSSYILHKNLKNSTLIKLPTFHKTSFLFSHRILKKSFIFFN